MPAFAERPLTEFNLALGEAISAIKFLQSSIWLRPRLNDLLNQQVIHGETRSKITNFLDQKDVDLSSLYRGTIVVICGATEYALRRITEEAVRLINKNAGNFDSISNTIRDQNIYRSGKALSTIFSPLDHLSFNYQELAHNLATCSTSAANFSLNPEAFSHSISNATPRQIEDIFRWLGLKFEWDEFGKNTRLQKFFGLTKTKETAKATGSKLAAIVLARNKIAHSGIGGVTITDVDIITFSHFLKIFIEEFSRLISTKIQ